MGAWRKKLGDWASFDAKIETCEKEFIENLLNDLEDPKALVDKAVSLAWNKDQLLQAIAKAPKKIIEVPVTSPTPAPEPSGRRNLIQIRLPKVDEVKEAVLGNKKWLIVISIGVLVLIVIAVLAFGYFGQKPKVALPTLPVTSITTPKPGVNPTAVPGSVKTAVPTEKTATAVRKVSETNPTPAPAVAASFKMRPPKSLPDLFTNADWNFLIFMAVMIIMIVLAKQERFAEQQQTDWRVISIGLSMVGVGILFSELFALGISQSVKFLTGYNFVIDKLWVEIVFLFGAMVAYITASLTGKVDWTPVSVGSFTMGGFLVAFNPEGPGRIIGYILIAVGIIVHVIELGSEKGTAGALGLTILGLVLFVACRAGFEAIFALIGSAVLPNGSDFFSQAVSWLALGAYNNRVLWATAISLVIGFALGNTLAALIFPPLGRMLPVGGQVVGTLVPTEDTPRIDSVISFMMGIVCYWLIVGHF